MLARLALIALAVIGSGQFVGCASMGRSFVGGGRCGDACGCAAPCGGDPCDCGDQYGCGEECSCGMPSGKQPSMAGQKWECCDGEGPKLCYCTGPSGECCHRGCCGWLSRWWHGDACGCGDCCEEAACGCEPGCAAECGSGCVDCCASPKGPCASLWNALCGCSGCDSEVYWSEWHNDPPRCCDPCDQCGNWIGPGAGSYRAPYDHPYAAPLHSQGTYVGSKQSVTRR